MLIDLVRFLTFPITWMVIVFIVGLIVSYLVSNRISKANYYYEPGTYWKRGRYTISKRQGQSNPETGSDALILLDEILDDQGEM